MILEESGEVSSKSAKAQERLYINPKNGSEGYLFGIRKRPKAAGRVGQVIHQL